jgi:glycosyltransferase involved in cell wall biosynthesis
MSGAATKVKPWEDRDMRIAYVVKEFPVVSQTFVASELVELRRRGVELRILSLRPPPGPLRHRFVTRAGLDGLTVYGRRAWSRALRELDPELLHAHFATEAAAAARSLSARTRIPFTFTAHGYDVHHRPPADLPSRASAAAAVITVSEANAQALTALGVDRARVRVIRNGVDLSRFRRPQRATPERGLIVCVARHHPAKNLTLLLEACALLRDRGVPFRCLLVGDGRSGPALRSRTAKLGLESLVEFAGALDHDDVAAVWRRASIAVLTSRREGLPVSLIEAAATGVPAVATAVGGVPELVAHEETGLLVPPGDARALADALARLLAEPKRARELGRAARARAEEHFSLTRQVDELLGLWQTT